MGGRRILATQLSLLFAALALALFYVTTDTHITVNILFLALAGAPWLKFFLAPRGGRQVLTNKLNPVA